MTDRNNPLDRLSEQLQSNDSASGNSPKEVKASKWDSLPPVHLWNPPLSGTIDIRIDKEGLWWYQGNQIKREKVVKLFSRIIKKENNEYFLVTPVEKWKFEVEDCPWIITQIDFENNSDNQPVIYCTTNLGDRVLISNNHPLVMRRSDDEKVPYAMIRNEIYARLNRQTYYSLTANVIEEGEQLGVWSDGQFFTLM